jgi:hypothetical protein
MLTLCVHADQHKSLHAAGRPGRPELSEVAPATSDESSKVVLVFCRWDRCGPHWVNCYCCLNNPGKKEVCYDTRDECKANCPVCDPHCPPSPPLTTTNSTLYNQELV